MSTAPGLAGLEAIPHPDLSTLEDPVRETLQQAIAAAENARGPGRADAFGRLGMLYQAHQLFDAATVAYSNALVLAPDDPRWNYYLAFLNQETGAFGKAVELYRRALELMPDYLPVEIRLAEALLDTGETAAARQQFETVLRTAPDSAPALAGLGRIALDEARYTEAIEYLEAALQHDPAANRLHYLLALAYREQGDLENARLHAGLRGQEAPALADPLMEAMAGLSLSSNYYVSLGFTAAYGGRYREAEAQFREAVRVSPEDPTARAALGRILELQQRFPEALEAFDASLRLQPKHVMANYFKGALLEHLKQDADARKYYRAALSVEPDRSEIRLLLGRSLMRAGSYEDAAAELATTTRFSPGDSPAWYYLGLARLASDECDAALLALNRALELAPRFRPALQASARAAATCPDVDPGRRSEALALARRLAAEGNTAEDRETLAMALAGAGDFEAAARLQQELVQAEDGGEGFLTTNLRRYRAALPAERPWPAKHPVFAPKRVSTYNR